MPEGSAEPFELILKPLRLEVGAQEIVLDSELMIANSAGVAADGVRLSVAMMSARPDQDSLIAAFLSGPQIAPAGPPFDLPAGRGGRMPIRLTLPRDRLHVVQIGGRPMFVPLVMLDLRWRGGVSLRRFGSSFMVGTAGQGDKLGPIWLDRMPDGKLAATRYLPKTVAAD